MVHCVCLCPFNGTFISHHKGDFNDLFEEKKENLREIWVMGV